MDLLSGKSVQLKLEREEIPFFMFYFAANSRSVRTFSVKSHFVGGAAIIDQNVLDLR